MIVIDFNVDVFERSTVRLRIIVKLVFLVIELGKDLKLIVQSLVLAVWQQPLRRLMDEKPVKNAHDKHQTDRYVKEDV